MTITLTKNLIVKQNYEIFSGVTDRLFQQVKVHAMNTWSAIPFDAAMSRRSSLISLGTATAWWTKMANSRLEAASPTKPEWAALAEQFLIDPDSTYLNTASLGSIPKPILEARQALERRLEGNPVGEGFGPTLREAEAVAGKIAESLGCDTDEVTVTRNTTEGVNFIAEGINLKPGDHVLTTNHEHGGGLGAWKFLEKHRGIVLDIAEIGAPPQSEDEIVEAFRRKITPETKVLFCSHVTFSSGVMLPIKRLSELAHQQGSLMAVDGAQTWGALPVNVKELDCDAFAASGHKFLLGPKGTGMLYIARQARDRIQPMQLGDGMGYYTAIRGTNCLLEAIGLGHAIDWSRQIGSKRIADRLIELRNALYAVLKAEPAIRIHSPSPGDPLSSHLVSFSIIDRGRHPAVEKAFVEDKIIVKHVGINGIDYRLSVHLYNTEDHVERFAKSLRRGLA